MSNEPVVPRSGIMEPFAVGYFLAILEKRGQITTEDWNKAIAAAEKNSPSNPTFHPRPPVMRGKSQPK